MLKSCYKEGVLEAGLDEAGRGCLAGPVFAAAVVLPPHFCNELINDSKVLSEKQRLELRPLIEEKALAWSVAMISPQEIDQINILNASIKAMNQAVVQLKLKPELLLVDGNRFYNSTDIDYRCIVKGDAKFLSIAAASILAKTYRDDFMNEISVQYPQYQWNKNKGYPTSIHREAIKNFGVTPHHRKSFTLIPSQLKLEL